MISILVSIFLILIICSLMSALITIILLNLRIMTLADSEQWLNNLILVKRNIKSSVGMVNISYIESSKVLNTTGHFEIGNISSQIKEILTAIESSGTNFKYGKTMKQMPLLARELMTVNTLKEDFVR